VLCFFFHFAGSIGTGIRPVKSVDIDAIVRLFKNVQMQGAHGSQFDKLTVTSLTMAFFCHFELVEGQQPAKPC
jgi:hypothetical protein